MGLILDSSVVIAAERRGDSVGQLIEKFVNRTGDQEAALSAIGLTELIHGIYRARMPETRLRRESFLNVKGGVKADHRGGVKVDQRSR